MSVRFVFFSSAISILFVFFKSISIFDVYSGSGCSLSVLDSPSTFQDNRREAKTCIFIILCYCMHCLCACVFISWHISVLLYICDACVLPPTFFFPNNSKRWFGNCVEAGNKGFRVSFIQVACIVCRCGT